MNSDLDGFSPEEIQMIGAVARYHRKRMPKAKDIYFTKMTKASARVVNVLSAILRIADGLDRTHFSVVKSLDCKVRSRSVMIKVKARQDAELEMWQTSQRTDLFEKLFKRKVILKLKGRS